MSYFCLFEGTTDLSVVLSHVNKLAVLRCAHKTLLGEADGLDSEGHHGRRFVLLPHTHIPQRRP